MTRGITIEGGIWDDNNLNQQRDQFEDEAVRAFSAALNLSIFYPPLMSFTYVEDFSLRGVTVKDPEAFAVRIADSANIDRLDYI